MFKPRLKTLHAALLETGLLSINEERKEQQLSNGTTVIYRQRDDVWVEYLGDGKEKIHGYGEIWKASDSNANDEDVIKNYEKNIDDKLIKDFKRLKQNGDISSEKYKMLISKKLPKTSIQTKTYKGKLFKARIGSHRFILAKDGTPLAWDTREDIYRDTNRLDALLKKL